MVKGSETGHITQLLNSNEIPWKPILYCHIGVSKVDLFNKNLFHEFWN